MSNEKCEPEYIQVSNFSMLDAQRLLFECLTQIRNLLEQHNITFWLDFGTLLGARRYQTFIPWDDDVDLCILSQDLGKVEGILRENFKDSTKYRLRSGQDLNSQIMVPLKIEILECRSVSRELNKRLISEDLHPFLSIDIFTVSHSKKPLNTFSRNAIGFLSRIRARIQTSNMTSFDRSSKGFLISLIRLILKSRLTKRIVAFATYRFEFDSPIPESLLVRNAFNATAGQTFQREDVFPLRKVNFNGQQYPAPANINSYLSILYGSDFLKPPPEHLQIPHAIAYKLRNS